jgi:hypothetical protein
LPKKISGFERERLHIVTSGTNLLIVLIKEQPIPEEPPVTMITEKRFNVSLSGTRIGIFVSRLIWTAASTDSVKLNQ